MDIPELPQDLWREIYLIAQEAYQEDTRDYHIARFAQHHDEYDISFCQIIHQIGKVRRLQSLLRRQYISPNCGRCGRCAAMGRPKRGE